MSVGDSKNKDNFLDTFIQVATLGSVVTENGQFKRLGGAWQALDEGIGEITGRNIAREQATRTEAQIKKEDERRAKDQMDAQFLAQQQDIQSSNQALAGRATAQAKTSGNLPAAKVDSTNLLGTGQDFLGL